MYMKRTVSCIIAMVLCFTASVSFAAEASYTVDEIREQITVPWRATYETKWRTIEVDIQPTVPNVQTMPVLMVRPAFWVPRTDEDVAWTSGITGLGDSFTMDMGDIWGDETEAKKGKKSDNITCLLYAPFDYDEPYAPDNALTINEMFETLQNVLNNVNHDHFGIDTDHLLRIHISGYVGKGTHEYLLPASLAIYPNTTLRNIPIYGHAIDSINSPKDSELFYDPHLILNMRNQSSFTFFGKTVYETEQIAADIPLCSFELVQQALEQEIMEGHIRAIYSVDLGYTLYNIAGTSRKPGAEWIAGAEFYAVPTWRCVCLYSEQAKKELPGEAYEDPYSSLYYKTLYVNAQTGELIDPENNSKGCGDYPGITTWEEVK